MEQLLLKLARQLDSLDEASLMSLWEKYAMQVNKFEPTQRWQEAVLVLSFIQAKRWKNQLFNTHWAARTRGVPLDMPDEGENLAGHPSFGLDFSLDFEEAGNTPNQKQTGRKAKILPFVPAKKPETQA